MWPCGGTGYHCSGCGGTWYAFTDSGVQVAILVIIMVLMVVLGMLPLIMQLAMWWSCGGTGYASTDYARWWYWLSL